MVAVLIYSTLILLVFVLSDVLYHKLKIQVDHTRKFAHVLSGIITLTFPIFIDSLWQISLMTILFLSLLYTSEYKKWFRGITGVERKTKGSWLFVLSVWVCFVVYLRMNDAAYFVLPIAVLAFADTAAFFVGQILPIQRYTLLYGKKSIGGTLAFLISAILVFLLYQYFTPSAYLPFNLVAIFILSLVATIAEASSSKGWDNFTVPIVTLCCIYFQQIYLLSN